MSDDLNTHLYKLGVKKTVSKFLGGEIYKLLTNLLSDLNIAVIFLGLKNCYKMLSSLCFEIKLLHVHV